MSFSIYDASVPPMIRMLESLSKILDKAVAQAKERDIPLSELLEARLAPDMHPFTRQIQIASDAAKGCAARLTGGEAPSFADTEASFPELQTRIANTIGYLKGRDAGTVRGRRDARHHAQDAARSRSNSTAAISSPNSPSRTSSSM